MKPMNSLKEALVSLYGETAANYTERPVGGGDINDASCLTLQDGTRLFLKTNAGKPVSFFQAEATGLAAIRSTQAISVPTVLAVGDDKENGAFLIMEYLDRGASIPSFWEDFAHQLFEMHSADTTAFTNGGSFGFTEDNYIGAKPQSNRVCESWIEFFRDCRLKPRFEQTASYFDSSMQRKINSLLDHLDRYLVEPTHPSLLHGDLWGGNYTVGPDGKAWLIDPAVYVGHAEADFAMTELFGGFSPVFYQAYRELSGLDSSYRDRRDLYNLFHLLNHLYIFGGSYLASVERIVTHYA